MNRIVFQQQNKQTENYYVNYNIYAMALCCYAIHYHWMALPSCEEKCVCVYQVCMKQDLQKLNYWTWTCTYAAVLFNYHSAAEQIVFPVWKCWLQIYITGLL